QPRDERRASIDPVHHIENEDSSDNGDYSRGDVGDERCIGGEPGFDEDDLTVVHDRVDAGELLTDSHTHADEHDPDQPFAVEELPVADPLLPGRGFRYHLD